MPLIESPCRRVCVLDSVTGLCIGCGRDRAEIGGWLRYSTEERRTIMAALPERLSRMTRRDVRGGRAGTRGHE
jgi:predicted Fe-S protein YdhL (DUF1289 family)